MGEKVLGWKSKTSIIATNLSLASYGACVRSVGKGHKKPENIINSILTGNPNAPIPYPRNGQKPTKEQEELLEKVNSALNEMSRLSNVTATPTPISTFCLKPENKDLKGLCK